VKISSKRFLAGAMAASLVLAACGGDDDVADTTPEPTAESTGDMTAEPTAESTGDMTAEPTAEMDVAGTLIGAGSSAQAAAMQAWQAGFQGLHPDATIEYDPIGSGGGREQFLAGATNFAGSDAFLKDEEYAASKDTCAGDQGAINLPHYISPVAIAYNLPGVDQLNLTSEAIAGIFAGTITKWNDPAIADANAGVDLPDDDINPVHRSDESGTTENFTDYLSAVQPDIWTFGKGKEWPDVGGEGAPQTSGVVAAIAAGEGSIGYADASQVGDLSTALVGVGDGFVAYSPEAAAKSVEVSNRLEGRSPYDFGFELDRLTTEAGVYPITLVSYHIVCLQYDSQETVDLVKSFMLYTGSAEGQAAAASAAGSAPISAELSAQIADAVAQISVAG
jgi:phosphate transport system substrate-binding protein